MRGLHREAMSSVVQQSLIVREEFEQQHEQTVREEIERFRARAEQVLAGTVTEDEFRSFRLRYGIYGQRQPGVQMVRTKFPSGMVTSTQLERLAELADEFGGARGHLTTRQNLQYHFVPLARVADLMHKLADAGLTTREACFNTVRNVTACPLAGLSHDDSAQIQDRFRRLPSRLHGQRDQRYRPARAGTRGQARIPRDGGRRPGAHAIRGATAG